MNLFGMEIDNYLLVLGAVVALLWWHCCSKEGLSFRPIRDFIVGEKPLAFNELYMPGNKTELPVGGQAAKLGSTTTWFARGGKVGGMDNIKDASSMGFDRPAYLNIYSQSNIGASAGPMPGSGLLPEGASLLDVGPSVGPDNPVLTSTSDRSRDLSGRSDVVIPRVDDGSNFQSSTPVSPLPISTFV